LRFGLLAHGGLHVVDARLYRLGLTERVAAGDGLKLAMISSEVIAIDGKVMARLCAPGRPASLFARVGNATPFSIAK
jgi:hypothetical protein